MPMMRYRLALDLGSTSLGWAMLRLDQENAPCAVIKAGVRIFSDGRNPKDGSSLAVTRREARAMRWARKTAAPSTNGCTNATQRPDRAPATVNSGWKKEPVRRSMEQILVSPRRRNLWPIRGHICW